MFALRDKVDDLKKRLALLERDLEHEKAEKSTLVDEVHGYKEAYEEFEEYFNSISSENKSLRDELESQIIQETISQQIINKYKSQMGETDKRIKELTIENMSLKQDFDKNNDGSFKNDSNIDAVHVVENVEAEKVSVLNKGDQATVEIIKRTLKKSAHSQKKEYDQNLKLLTSDQDNQSQTQVPHVQNMNSDYEKLKIELNKVIAQRDALLKERMDNYHNLKKANLEIRRLTQDKDLCHQELKQLASVKNEDFQSMVQRALDVVHFVKQIRENANATLPVSPNLENCGRCSTPDSYRTKISTNKLANESANGSDACNEKKSKEDDECESSFSSTDSVRSKTKFSSSERKLDKYRKKVNTLKKDKKHLERRLETLHDKLRSRNNKNGLKLRSKIDNDRRIFLKSKQNDKTICSVNEEDTCCNLENMNDNVVVLSPEKISFELTNQDQASSRCHRDTKNMNKNLSSSFHSDSGRSEHVSRMDICNSNSSVKRRLHCPSQTQIDSTDLKATINEGLPTVRNGIKFKLNAPKKVFQARNVLHLENK